MTLKAIVEEIQSYSSMLKSKRRDNVYILLEIMFLSKQALSILRRNKSEKN